MWLPSRLFILVPLLLFILHSLLQNMHLFISSLDFKCFTVFKMILLYLFHLPAKPLCLTYFCWYSGPDTVVVEAEPEEAVGDPHRERLVS